MKRQVLFAVLMMIVGVAHAGLYRSIDKDGKVVYSDTPLMGSDDVEEVKAIKLPSDLGLPYETQQAMQNFPVSLYVFEKCGATCDQARALLKQRGIPHAEKNLKTQEELDAFQKLAGSPDLPALMIGRNWIKGFRAELWHKELDIAGYPKSAPLAAQPPAPAPAPAPQSAEPAPHAEQPASPAQ